MGRVSALPVPSLLVNEVELLTWKGHPVWHAAPTPGKGFVKECPGSLAAPYNFGQPRGRHPPCLPEGIQETDTGYDLYSEPPEDWDLELKTYSFFSSCTYRY